MSRTRREFTPDFKFQVVLDLLTGRRRRVDVLREHELAESTVDRWCQQFRERGPQIFAQDGAGHSVEGDRIVELERMVGRLALELEAAKKASRWPSSR
jgi:transposase-like protein